ncbi:hypothetical protein CMI37_18060 [Candidatus Pacearchaeota archaeon]|nr:hypothetical protein [Candidatus Pacearchaeota archaeon]
MDNPSQTTKGRKSKEDEPHALFRKALQFAGHAIGCEDHSYCRCGYEELCKYLARAHRERTAPPEEAIDLLRESAPDITGHKGGGCEDRRCQCGLKKALRRLRIRAPAADQFATWWCSKCSREHDEDDLSSFWDSKDALSAPFDSTLEALQEANKLKCEIGNCPTVGCSGPVRRSILSLRKTIPDVPF